MEGIVRSLLDNATNNLLKLPENPMSFEPGDEWLPGAKQGFTCTAEARFNLPLLSS
jgi:hypothetical protein